MTWRPDQSSGRSDGVPIGGKIYGTEFDVDNLLRMDSVTQMDVLDKAKNIMTPDEQRDSGRGDWDTYGPTWRACDRCLKLTDPALLRGIGVGEQTGYKWMVCPDCAGQR